MLFHLGGTLQLFIKLDAVMAQVFSEDLVKDLLSSASLVEKVKLKQLECIINILKGHDTLAILPTGYDGKSFIYQVLPLLCMKLSRLGFSFPENPMVMIVSPLVALIDDQVSKCNNACSFKLQASNLESGKYSEIANGKFNILFGTPESWLENKQWRNLLSSEYFVQNLVCLVCFV